MVSTPFVVVDAHRPIAGRANEKASYETAPRTIKPERPGWPGERAHPGRNSVHNCDSG